ncbi:MAG: hypothetical protein IEMM0002_0481 [bacterium]|nr:MAG: hypothetical protein IEMM0002_0481 [bacterium]
MCAQYKAKKEQRFFTDGITYEISNGKMVNDDVQFEISSKIPQEIFSKKGVTEKYFREVKKLMMSKVKKPADAKMENIIHSTNISEIKDRDYVKCTYVYKENELYGKKDIEDIVRKVQNKNMRLPEIRGAATLPGRAVLYALNENVYKNALNNVNDLIKSNAEVMKNYKNPAKTAARAV